VPAVEIEIEIHTLERTPAWTQGAAPYALPTNAVRACGSQHTRPTASAGTSPKTTGQHNWRKPKSRGCSHAIPIIAAGPAHTSLTAAATSSQLRSSSPCSLGSVSRATLSLWSTPQHITPVGGRRSLSLPGTDLLGPQRCGKATSSSTVTVAPQRFHALRRLALARAHHRPTTGLLLRLQRADRGHVRRRQVRRRQVRLAGRLAAPGAPLRDCAGVGRVEDARARVHGHLAAPGAPLRDCAGVGGVEDARARVHGRLAAHLAAPGARGSFPSETHESCFAHALRHDSA
jgi:hypothetical protein